MMFNSMLYGAGTTPGSVLHAIPEMVGGKELWRSSSPSSPGSRNISKWSEMQSHCMDGSIAEGFQKQSILTQLRNTRREKETKERQKNPIVFPGKKETLRALLTSWRKYMGEGIGLERSN